MWPFKTNKYKKLKREEVVDSIIEMEKREQSFEDDIISKKSQIKDLMEKGRQDKDHDMRIFYAKKINNLQDDIKNIMQRNLYILYNIKLLNRLKDAIDDKQFIADVSGENLSDLLGDQKHLAQFLNGALQTKVKAEDILTGADDLFSEVQESYEPNEKIYSSNDKDDDYLSMFETEDSMELSQNVESGEFTHKQESDDSK